MIRSPEIGPLLIQVLSLKKEMTGRNSGTITKTGVSEIFRKIDSEIRVIHYFLSLESIKHSLLSSYSLYR